MDWKTAKTIDFRALERTVGPVDLDGVRRIAMDEFAIQKGHRYATVVVDVERKRVLWVGRGRSRAEVRPFFELLGPERCAPVQAVAMDMNTAYDLEVRQHCPNARAVYHPSTDNEGRNGAVEGKGVAQRGGIGGRLI